MDFVISKFLNAALKGDDIPFMETAVKQEHFAMLMTI